MPENGPTFKERLMRAFGKPSLPLEQTEALVRDELQGLGKELDVAGNLSFNQRARMKEEFTTVLQKESGMNKKEVKS